MSKQQETFSRSVRALVTVSVLCMAVMGCSRKGVGIAAPARDALSQKLKEKDLSEEEAVLDSLALSVGARQKIMEDLGKYLEDNYSFGKVKVPNIRRHFEDCARREYKFPKHKFINLDFDVRFLECVAGLKDGHLLLQASRPKVISGITIREIGGRFFVASIYGNPKFLENVTQQPGAGKSVFESLKLGAEVIAIDGQKVTDQVDVLSKMISASTEGARRELAVASLMERDFLYPTKSDVEIQLKDRTVRLKWWYARLPFSSVAWRYLKSVGIEPIYVALDSSVSENDFEETNRSDWVGYSDVTPLEQNQMEEFFDFDSRKKVVLRFSQRDVDADRKYCYLQILSFNSKVLINRKGAAQFAPKISEIIKKCESEKRALILDLRQNEGGELDNARALMSAVTPADKTYPGFYYSGRATPNFLKYMLQFDFGPADTLPKTPEAGQSLPENLVELRLRPKAATQAIQQKLDYISKIPTRNIVASDNVKGFSQKMAVLVSPNCMSACDVFTKWVQVTGRGVLVGSHSAGAFGGFKEDKFGIDRKSRWNDQKHQIYTIHVPNIIHGVLTSPVSEQDALIPFDVATDLLEGSPVMADEIGRYSVSELDLKTKGAGFLFKALDVLGLKPSELSNP